MTELVWPISFVLVLVALTIWGAHKWVLLLIAAPLLTTITSQRASEAASYRTLSPGVVELSGPIEPDDEQALRRIISRTNLRVLVLANSPGGSTDASFAMARMLRENRLATHVTGTCSSACATVFAGGFVRSAAPGGRLCVHSARDPDTAAGSSAREDDLSRQTTIELTRFLWELNVPYSMLGRLVSTPPSRVSCADEDDYRNWNVQIR